MHLSLPSLTLAMAGLAAAQDHTLGFIGCSMAENVATGYVAAGGQRLWGPYGTGGAVVQSWTDSASASWQSFDAQAAEYGLPTAVWVQICIFAQAGVSYDEVGSLIANAREHAAPDAEIYISGQPLYEGGATCFLAGAGGAELTDEMATRAGEDEALNVTYVGKFWLGDGEVQDGCHANAAGLAALGAQALEIFG